MNTATHVNTNVIQQYKSLDEPGQPTLLNELIQIFQETYLARSESLKSAWQKEDYERMRKEAHALRNTCANVGAAKMVEITQALEYQDYPTDSEKVQSQIRDLDDEYEAVIEELFALSADPQAKGETPHHHSGEVE